MRNRRVLARTSVRARVLWTRQLDHDGGRVTKTATLLSRVEWDAVNERVRHEQRNREVYVPPISLFRWWARRPHALIGALIDAACEDGGSLVVSDPFSGGGTVALEAARRGLPLYAQDLHPWVVAGLASALDGTDPDVLDAAMAEVLDRVSTRCADLYTSTCSEHGGTSELSHVFSVRARACPSCSRTTFLYPYSLLSLASRQKAEAEAFFGCPACGLVSRHQSDGIAARVCPGCERLLASPDESLLAGRVVACPGDDCNEVFAAFDGAAPIWKPVLVQRMCVANGKAVSHFDIPTAADAAMRQVPSVPGPLSETIPTGIETVLLRRAGFKRWADLYPPRQLVTLAACAAVINEMDISDPIRARLRLALCGAAEMAGYLSRWDRYYPKAFEAMANHRFPALGFACETNLLARRGRGTLHRRFAHSVAAARWSTTNMPLKGAVRLASSGDRRRRVGAGAVIACGSSERQLPSDGSIDLVLTDPPYFDDVQYAELASLFFVWARAVELLPATVALDLASEAVANAARGSGVVEYQGLLTRIFTEARRTMKPTGRLVLTYHNTDIQAWWALGRALHDAGLAVMALAVAEAENGSDHAKRNSRAFTSDLVIECRHATTPGIAPVAAREPATPEGRELYAAGRALAAAGTSELAAFIEQYRSERGPLAHPRIHTPPPEKT